VYQRFVQSLREAMRALWAEVDKLVVAIEEDRFTVAGEEVYKAETRSESLAFLFFKDGIREITFLPGLEDDELTRFLRVIQRARKGRGGSGEGEDLLTILWEADLGRFKYQFIDMLAEGVEMPEAGAGGTPAQLQGAHDAETAEEERAKPGETAAEEPQKP